MDFGKLLSFLNDNLNGGKPSVIGNVVKGRQWNESLPRFGGVAPEAQSVVNPNVASPIPAPDQLTRGMIYDQGDDKAREFDAQFDIKPLQPTPTPTPEVLGAQTQEPRSLEELIIDVMNRNKIPAPVGLGIAHAEGGRIGDNNPFNINATDSNPGGATDYATPEAGVQGFADLINKNPRYQKATQLRDDPDAMLRAIQDAGYAGDPQTWRQRSIDTGGAGKTYPTWADFIKATRGFQDYAN